VGSDFLKESIKLMAAKIKHIVLCDYRGQLDLRHLNFQITYSKPDLPSEVEERVEKNWESFTALKSGAINNLVGFLVSYECSKQEVRADLFLAGYKYNQYFNRDDKRMIDSKIANDNHYNPLASMILVSCENENIFLLGNKIDFGFKKLSGFGGFTNSHDQIGNKIDPQRHIERKLLEEIGCISEAIIGSYYIGLNFYPIVGPKGYEAVYITHLDGRREQLQKLFFCNSQFSNQFIPVEANPKSLAKFLRSTSWEPTTNFLGSLITYVGSKFGEQELNKFIKEKFEK